MGCTVREKHIRANRRPRSSKSDNDHNSKSMGESGTRQLNYQMGGNEIEQSPNPKPVLDDGGWGYCSEDQLEEILLKNLEFLYNEAISKLVSLGYDEDVALKAILRNGHCYGGMDILTNILHNSLAYLNSGCSIGDANSEESEQAFFDLKQLEEYSLAGMVYLLQQVRPNLSKGDAMWCLLISDLQLGRASGMEIPPLPSANSKGCGNLSPSNVEKVGNNQVGVAPPPLFRFHGGWGFGNGGTSEFPLNRAVTLASEMPSQRDIELPKRFNLTPSMKLMLKRNVAAFAAGYRANANDSQVQSQGFSNTPSDGDSLTAITTGYEVPEQVEEQLNSENQDVVNSMLSKFRDLNLDENTENVPEDQKDGMIYGLIHQIKDLERQVKERKEWAHQKAMQAARKLSHDMTELKMLRMERDETQRLKKGKQTLEDATMKKLSEMENALRKASGQVDRANAAVRRLETENAEIKAEMEASKLNASESAIACLEVAKREKRYLKRLLAWEKQKTKLQEEIAAEKQNIIELREQLKQVEAAQKEAETMWRLELEAKEVALAQVQEERRLKEATEASTKRGHEALHLKVEIEFQRYKDDLQRLEQELSRLKITAQSTELSVGNTEEASPKGDTIAKLLNDLDNVEDPSDNVVCCDRECLICKKAEVSIVFLPCAHQVLCANCNENYGKKGKAACPSCHVPIEQRIRVFGASS